MDWTPVVTAAVSAGSGLSGALLGYYSTQRAARGNRASDLRKREVDRLIVALSELEEAYAADAHSPRSDDTRLRLADRGLDRAVGMVSHTLLRKHAESYALKLQTFYLYLDTAELDELDAEVKVPSADELKVVHRRLIEELRGYESK